MPRAGYAEWDDSAPYDDMDERPSRRARVKPLRWLRLALLCSISIAGLAYLALQKEQDRQQEDSRGVPSPALIAPAPVWKPISPSPAVYALEEGLGPVTYEARQHASGAREDTLILKDFGEAQHARITLVQERAEPERSFFVEIVRRAAGAGLSVTHMAQSRLVATRFGPVEAAPATLTGAVAQACEAFRFSDPQAGFGFQGWLCGLREGEDGDAALACLVEGISLTGAASPSLKAVFARAGRSRSQACGSGAAHPVRQR